MRILFQLIPVDGVLMVTGVATPLNMSNVDPVVVIVPETQVNVPSLYPTVPETVESPANVKLLLIVPLATPVADQVPPPLMMPAVPEVFESTVMPPFSVNVSVVVELRTKGAKIVTNPVLTQFPSKVKVPA